MGEGITGGREITIGMDVSDRFTEAYAIDDRGAWVESWRMPTKQEALRSGLSRYPGARVVLEVGCHSPWISRQLKAEGFDVIVANPRRVRLIAESDKKSDRFDAEHLARLGRLDPGLLSPIVHRGEQAQRDRVLLLARDGLVRARTQLIDQVRGFAKSLGSRLPSSSSEGFPKRVRGAVSDDLFPGLSTMLAMIEQLTAEIRSMDREIERLCRERYEETGGCDRFRESVHSTALACVLTLEDPAAVHRAGTSARISGCDRDGGTREDNSPAADHEGGRRSASPLAGDVGPIHSRPIRPRHGPQTIRTAPGRARREVGEEARSRGSGAQARRTFASMWITGEEYQAVGYAAAGKRAA